MDAGTIKPNSAADCEVVLGYKGNRHDYIYILVQLSAATSKTSKDTAYKILQTRLQLQSSMFESHYWQRLAERQNVQKQFKNYEVEQQLTRLLLPMNAELD